MLGLMFPPKREVKEENLKLEVVSVVLTQSLNKPFKKIVIQSEFNSSGKILSYFKILVDDEQRLITHSLSKAVKEYNKY